MTQRDSAPTFQSKVNLVLVPVVVRDSMARPIGNLRKEDFQLFDKGKPQTIASFSVVKRAGNIELKELLPSDAPAAPAAAPATVINTPERYAAYLFDDLNIEFADLAYIQKAAIQNLKKSLLKNDRVAIYTTSGRANLDFTGDEAKLEDAILKVRVQQMMRHSGAGQCPDLSYYISDLIVNKNDQMATTAALQETIVCANLDPTKPGVIQQATQIAQSAARQELTVGEQNTRLSLNAIKNVIRRLSAVPGERLLVIASPGFLTQNPEAISDKAEILDLAARTNVMISAIDARGLYTGQMDASQQAPASPLAQQLWGQYQLASAQANEDVLGEMADGTGGTFFHNNNDLNAGFARVAATPEVSYVLGFSPTALKPDGSFHKLKVTLANGKGLAIQARRGYFAQLHKGSEEDAAKSDIQDAIFSREEMSDIPLDLQTQFFKADSVNAKLTVVAKLDLRRLHFKKVNGRNNDSVTVVSVLFDNNGNYINGMSKTLEMKLRDETLGRLNTGVAVKSTFDVKPGVYVVRLVVREIEGQAMSARNGAVEIP